MTTILIVVSRDISDDWVARGSIGSIATVVVSGDRKVDGVGGENSNANVETNNVVNDI